ncbi:signal peptide peptidase 1 isoform X1 [Physcomitrium patens]|uniref:Uncharacterized protein n=1 Tax=Physcomitrium patens TaxID=3218 RepID=A0A2K1KTA6_PHYPA|nr:signal peptide peptidase 1-like isoform X1 [Physcomitrium patens]PNR57017.1 hypothetical protein PHYPA_004010 [Physcomitrium patens]|eukprot:XP_024371626.1 signal peptide peptidase 1-like isoform X1 [Physcomitrella patens]
MRTFACSPVALQQGSCVSNQPQWISSLQLRNLKPSSIGRFRGSPSQRICSSCGPHLCRKSVSLTQVGCKIDGSDSPSVTTFSNLRLTERRSQLQSQAGRQPASNDENDVVAEIVEKELDTDVVSDEWQWTKTNQELIAYTLLLVAVPIGTILPLSHLQWSGAFYFLFLAVWTVYVGSHRSLGKKPPQNVSFKQGLAAPLFCSVSLFGFYSLLRFFPNLDIRSFISAYLGVAGIAAVASNLAPPLRAILPNPNNTSWHIDFPKWLVVDEGEAVHVTLTPADLVATVVGIGAAIASKQSGAPFTLNNFIAVCIVTELLQLLSLGSFVTAATMLSGLLLYDVFWVFGSSNVFGDNVMVTVATSPAFDGPMKLIFPNATANTGNPYSILGLGDIAAPGLLIALMLRFDRSRSKRLPGAVAEANTQQEPADKTYFITCIASYIFGLTATVVANTVSGAAQPALLYLVPSLLFGVFIVAASRSESSLLLDYKEEFLPVAVKGDGTLE